MLERTAPEYQRKTTDALTTDGYAMEIMAAFDEMANNFGAIDKLAARLAATAVLRQAQATDEQLIGSIASALGISVDLASSIKTLNVQPQIEAATLTNVQLIKSIPVQAMERMKTSVLTDVSQGKRYEDLAADIQEQLDITENRAKLIARDQMAKVNAAITEAKQEALGIEKYQWSTSGDERVRESHAANEGQIFRWDTPPPTGHPGEDVLCRCVAIPVIDTE